MNSRIRTLISRRGGRQSGIALVETVIAMPLVIVVMLATAELGNAILQYNALTQYVRDGARYVSDNAETGSANTVNLRADVIAEAANVVAYGQISAGTPLMQGLSPANVTITDVGNGNVSVSVSFAYQPLLLGGIPDLIRGGSIGGAFTMNAEVIMRVLT